MIIAEDRIEVMARDRARVLARFQDDYRPAAKRRGLVFENAWSSPPCDLVDRPVVLTLRWQIADIPSWWAMRGASGDPAVTTFWRELAPLVVSRERRYFVAEPMDGGRGGGERAALASWPDPIDLTPHRVETRGWRETVQLQLPAGAAPTALEALERELGAAARGLPRIEASWIAPNLVADFGAGHLTWDLLFPDRAAATAARKSAVWRERIAKTLAHRCRSWTALGLETLGAGVAAPELKTGIKRTALFRALPGVETASVARWERDLLEMPAHVTTIRNWRLARAIPLDWSKSDVSPWTHVWEQEYETVEGLTIDYMVHPHHWAHVDRWFDPESGSQIVDTALCHAYCPLADGTVLGREAR